MASKKDLEDTIALEIIRDTLSKMSPQERKDFERAVELFYEGIQQIRKKGSKNKN